MSGTTTKTQNLSIPTDKVKTNASKNENEKLAPQNHKTKRAVPNYLPLSDFLSNEYKFGYDSPETSRSNDINSVQSSLDDWEQLNRFEATGKLLEDNLDVSYFQNDPFPLENTPIESEVYKPKCHQQNVFSDCISDANIESYEPIFIEDDSHNFQNGYDNNQGNHYHDDDMMNDLKHYLQEGHHKSNSIQTITDDYIIDPDDLATQDGYLHYADSDDDDQLDVLISPVIINSTLPQEQVC